MANYDYLIQLLNAARDDLQNVKSVSHELFRDGVLLSQHKPVTECLERIDDMLDTVNQRIRDLQGV